MTDDLERLVRSIEGEGPSPDFVSSLRERIVAETSTPTIVDDHPVVDIDLGQTRRETMMATRWKWVGLAAAVLVAVIVFVTFSDSDRLDTVGRDDESTTTTATPTTEQSTDTVVGTPASFDPDATPFSVEGVELEPGVYRVDAAGTPFSLTLDQPMTSPFNRNGWLQLAHPDWAGPDDRDIDFMRLTALSDPTQPAELLQDRDDGWPADDFAGWLENLTQGIQATDVEATTVGGRDAIRVDLELVDISCAPNLPATFCTTFGTNYRAGTKFMLQGSKYRVWVVDQGDEAPLAIVAGIRDEADSDWFATADRAVSSLAFGEIAPNPVLDPGAGPIELPLLGGIRIEAPGNAIIIPGPVPKVGSMPFDDLPGQIQFMANPLDRSGEPIDATELIERITAGSSEVTEVGSATVGGLSATVIDIFSGTGDINVKWIPESNPESGLGWFLPLRGRVWLVEHPDRGLLMISAEVFDDIDGSFPPVLGHGEDIIDSLEFIELD
jgi:hypothetical protein